MYSGLIDCAIKTAKIGGIKEFYRGVGIHLAKILPSNALFFIVYEEVLKSFHNRFN